MEYNSLCIFSFFLFFFFLFFFFLFFFFLFSFLFFFFVLISSLLFYQKKECLFLFLFLFSLSFLFFFFSLFFLFLFLFFFFSLSSLLSGYSRVGWTNECCLFRDVVFYFSLPTCELVNEREGFSLFFSLLSLSSSLFSLSLIKNKIG